MLLAEDEFDGDLNNLGLELRKMRELTHHTEGAMGKLSHLRDLQHRIAEAELSVPDVLRLISPELERTESRRAYGRIIKHNQRSYELSKPMHELPREVLYGVALRGSFLRLLLDYALREQWLLRLIYSRNGPSRKR